jgi:hypothetical protein
MAKYPAINDLEQVKEQIAKKATSYTSSVDGNRAMKLRTG